MLTPYPYTIFRCSPLIPIVQILMAMTEFVSTLAGNDTNCAGLHVDHARLGGDRQRLQGTVNIA